MNYVRIVDENYFYRKEVNLSDKRLILSSFDKEELNLLYKKSKLCFLDNETL